MSLDARVLKSIAHLIMETYMMDDVVEYERLYTIIHVCCADDQNTGNPYEKDYEDLLLNIPGIHDASFYVAKIAEALKA